MQGETSVRKPSSQLGTIVWRWSVGTCIRWNIYAGLLLESFTLPYNNCCNFWPPCKDKNTSRHIYLLKAWLSIWFQIQGVRKMMRLKWKMEATAEVNSCLLCSVQTCLDVSSPLIHIPGLHPLPDLSYYALFSQENKPNVIQAISSKSFCLTSSHLLLRKYLFPIWKSSFLRPLPFELEWICNLR